YDYLYQLRDKHRVSALVDLQQVRPLVHVSGRFGRERSGLALVLPLAWHPRNRNALIVWDLAVAPDMLQELSPEQLRRRLCRCTEELATGERHPGLMPLQSNACPVCAGPHVLRPVDIERLQLDLPMMLSRAEQLGQWREGLEGGLATIYCLQPGEAKPEAD